MKILDQTHPFFQPLWRRLAITFVAFGWAGFEYSMGSTGWALFFGALGLYCAWALLIAFKPDNTENDRHG